MNPEQLTVMIVGTAATAAAWLICFFALSWGYLL